MDSISGMGYNFYAVKPVYRQRWQMNSGSLYTPLDAEIIALAQLTPDEKLFTLRMTDGAALNHLPGQFVQLSLPGFTEAPISVASSPASNCCFDLAIRSAGSLTREMHRRVVGDTVGIRGPFGKGFDLAALRGQNLLLIAGGCGLAPLRSLIQYCEGCPADFGSLHILYGARNPDFLLFRDDLAVWRQSSLFHCSLTVDSVRGEGCFDGNVGLLPALVDPLAIDPASTSAVVVGPPPMFRPLIDALRRKGLGEERIYVSLERQMRCGVGKCGHCAIDHLFCCTDGPVFRLDRLAGVRGAI
jgi:NAD(P)H-flavin reductase